MENKPSLIPLANMARRLRVPVKWLRAEALAGRIPCLDAAGRLLFNPEVVEAALASRARGESPSEDITRPATVSIAPMDDDAGKKDQRIRDLEYERNERVLRAELARVQAEAAAMRKVLESPVQIGYGLLCRYMCHACCRAWSPGDQQTHEDDCVLARTTAGRDLLERLERAEALANKQTP